MNKISINDVYEEFLTELFSTLEGAINPYELQVSRSRYKDAMNKIQDKYGLRQGHPQFIEWIFTCVGRSPVIVDDKKGAEENE